MFHNRAFAAKNLLNFAFMRFNIHIWFVHMFEHKKLNTIRSAYANIKSEIVNY